nr:altered inheritance of mitochondria protein 44-like [Nicotiana tomentosiformis]
MQATQVCYMPYSSTKKDNNDWVAVLKVKHRDVIELPDEAITSTSEPNLPFQVEEVEVHLIDMNFTTDKNIILHDPNGDVIEMVEPIDDGLLIEHQEFEEESSEDEYETEDENEEDDEEEFEEETDDD